MSNRRLAAWVMLPMLLLTSSARTAPIDDARLRNTGPETANWLMYGRTYEDHRFIPLNQIDERSIGRLGLAWSTDFGTTRGLEATPLVEDGILYASGVWSVVQAIDAKTGKTLWRYDPKVDRRRALFICCDAVNRGVALYRGKVYFGTLDGRLIALDQRSGAKVWEISTADSARPYAISGAPRIAKGMVVIGNAGAEYGVRGYISAFDAETGKLRWRSYTVPGDPAKGFESKAMEAAAKSWNGEWWKVGGGGTAWEGIVYDPALDLLYFGTGNPTAWYRALRGKGDALYTASIIAVRASDGQIVWHFQTTPGDNWDYDATQPLMQAELSIGGRMRKVIMQANKNGFFYVLDRATGEFISGKPFVSGVNWATGLDPKGRPIESKTFLESTKPVIVSPHPDGAHNWNPMAFSPVTGLVYIPAKAGSHMLHVPDTKWTYNPDKNNIGMDDFYEGPLSDQERALPPARGQLVAWDPVRQRATWRASFPTASGGGVLATGGNLVFQGRADGILAAYRASDGKQVWSFDAGTGIMAPPVTYQVDGVQYVSVLAGWGGPTGLFNPTGWGRMKPGFGRLLTFRLDGKTAFKPLAFGHPAPPPMPDFPEASAETIHQGDLLYGANCAGCHGLNAVAGPLPDLRYARKETLEGIEQIVLGGSRATLGMPSFAKILKTEQVRAIRAFIVSRARIAATAGQGRP